MPAILAREWKDQRHRTVSAVENTTKVIEAAGRLVMPGGIDVHTHLDMPFGGTNSADDFESGTVAAAFGGTTTLIDFAIQTKGQSLRQAFETWMKKADRKAAVDYAFHCIITDSATRNLKKWDSSSMKECQASNCSWRIPACSWWTMARSSKQCRKPRNMAD